MATTEGTSCLFMYKLVCQHIVHSLALVCWNHASLGAARWIVPRFCFVQQNNVVKRQKHSLSEFILELVVVVEICSRVQSHCWFVAHTVAQVSSNQHSLSELLLELVIICELGSRLQSHAYILHFLQGDISSGATHRSQEFRLGISRMRGRDEGVGWFVVGR